MNASQKAAATQSQKLMIFVLSMSLYGLATLFTELILNLLILCDRTIKLSFITQDPGVIIAIFQMIRILIIIGDLAINAGLDLTSDL